MKNTTVIFLHIPKTAGRTLEFILERQYSRQEIYNIYGYGTSIADQVESLKKLSSQKKQAIKLIKGHYQFGLHEFLPQPCVYLTLLRNPIDRVLSHYNYVSHDQAHPFYTLIQEKKMSLKDYMSSGISVELNNGQTRLLSGQEKDYEFGQTPQILLDKAINHIEKDFTLVGLVEKFDEFLILLQQQLGYTDIRYVSRNITQKANLTANLSQETREIIQYYNDLDLQLYQYVQQKFQERLIENQPLIEQEKLKLYQANQQYQLWGRLQLLAQSATRKIQSLVR